jgi:hypothetical protein
MKVLVAIVLSALALTLNLRAQNVFISEFMPSNERILADEDGQFPDWIEIQNGGTAPVNLQGWFPHGQRERVEEVGVPIGHVAAERISRGVRVGQEPHERHHASAHEFSVECGRRIPRAREARRHEHRQRIRRLPEHQRRFSFGIAQKLTTTALLANSVPQILVPTSARSLAANWNQLAYTPGQHTGQMELATRRRVRHQSDSRGTPVNVAPAATAVQSTTYNGSTYPASLAINNILTHFSHTATTDSSAFWQVTLTNEMAILRSSSFNRGGVAADGVCGTSRSNVPHRTLRLSHQLDFSLLNPENRSSTARLSSATTSSPSRAARFFGAPSVIHRKRRPGQFRRRHRHHRDDQNVLALGEWW